MARPKLSHNLSSRIDALKHKSIVRYVVVGGITYVFDIAILVGSYSLLGTSRQFAATASFWLGLLFSFLMQKLFAFQDFKKEVKAISRQIFWYAGLVVVNYLITVLIVSLFPGRLIILSRTIALAITTLWNYLIYKKLIFK